MHKINKNLYFEYPPVVVGGAATASYVLQQVGDFNNTNDFK